MVVAMEVTMAAVAAMSEEVASDQSVQYIKFHYYD